MDSSVGKFIEPKETGLHQKSLPLKKSLDRSYPSIAEKVKKKKKSKEHILSQDNQWLSPELRQRLDNKAKEWPRFRYEIKGDWIEIIHQTGSTCKPIRRVGSPHRTLEIYRAARQCLLENLRGPITTPQEYKRLFVALHLDDLHLELMTVDGKVRGTCVLCFKDLNENQKSYCSEQCRNTAKQRRARLNHPERKLKR